MSPEGFGALLELVGMGREAALIGFVVLLRVGAAMALVPAFGEQVVPVRVKLAAALAFTAIVAPAVAHRLDALTEGPAGIALALASETLAGLILGIGLRVLVMVLQMAGTMAAQSTSLAQFFGGAGVDPQPAIAQILVMGGLALAVTSGLHVRLAELFVLSYDLLPPGRFPGPGALAESGTARIARAFALAFSLAAPFVIGALIYNMALGAINRAMPQLMVAFVGAPALTAGGLIMLLIVAPLAIPLWFAALEGYLAAPFAGEP